MPPVQHTFREGFLRGSRQRHHLACLVGTSLLHGRLLGTQASIRAPHVTRNTPDTSLTLIKNHYACEATFVHLAHSNLSLTLFRGKVYFAGCTRWKKNMRLGHNGSRDRLQLILFGCSRVVWRHIMRVREHIRNLINRIYTHIACLA